MRKSLRVYWVAALLALASAASMCKPWLAPAAPALLPLDLETLIPARFGPWSQVPQGVVGVVNPQQEALSRAIYNQTLTRLYQNPKDGQLMMLSVAYGADQRDALQLHYPEVCYPAQGFEVSSNTRALIATPHGVLTVRRLETRLNPQRNEPVTYWAMLGEHVVLDGMQKKWTEIRASWAGERADGLLFRVSSVDEAQDHAFAGQTAFITDLLEALPAPARLRLSGL
jgi:EpsI family protein